MASTSNFHFVPQYEAQKEDFKAFCEDHPLPEDRPRLPSPWPSALVSMAWRGSDLKDEPLTQLSSIELHEIKTACENFSVSGKALDEINKSTFPLPSLEAKLVSIRESLHNGLGIRIIRGIEPSALSMKAVFTTFAGIASHVSPQRGQQPGGKIIVHVTDLSDSGRVTRPGPWRNSALAFHADPTADVVAMMVIHPSTSGGEGIFCPVSTIYNELAATRPDLLCDLAEPDWPFDWPSTRDGSLVHRSVMFLGEKSAAAEMIFSRGALIRSHHGFRSSHVPLLTRRQGAALDALQLIAEEAAYRVQYEKGDLVFFNNRRVLHGRASFRDGDNGLEKRHLLRLWLRDEELAGTPPSPLDRVWLDRFGEMDTKGSDETRWPLIPVED